MQKTRKEMTASWLKDGRLSKGLTQKELSEKSHISIRSIQRIENGELVPRGHTLKTLAEILGLSFEEFMKSASDKGFVDLQSDTRSLSQPQRLILSVGICLTVLSLTWAYVEQSSSFPETAFELLVLIGLGVALITVILFFLWRSRG